MSIIQRIEKFDFSNVEFKPLNTFQNFAKGFLVKLQIQDFPENNKRKLLVVCPGFSIYSVRLHIEKDKALFTQLELCDRVQTYADTSGYVYLLEMKAVFQSPYKEEQREIIVDLPLNLFDAKKQEVFACYNGVRLSWIYNNEEVNCDHTFGELVANPETENFVCGAKISISGDLMGITKNVISECVEKSINFYSPKGYNTWAGDVMNFYHNGIYHLLYLHDRHHHCSRWEGGAHSVYHLTTKDFKSWQECSPVIELDEDWKTVGTGTMFFHNGKYYFSHGWHTTRMIPYEKTASFLMQEQTDGDRITPVCYAELKEKGLYPSGAIYVVSEYGYNFEQGDRVFHICENPSVYVDDENGLFMFGGYGSSGIWSAKRLQDVWTLDVKKEVPQSVLKPSTECPSMFTLNGYKYLIMGFVGYWKTCKNGEKYYDEAINGIDVYDGLSVPMVTKTKENRLIMAGWVGGVGWGSIIVHRELVQDATGRLFMKWLKELAPDTSQLERVEISQKNITLNERQSYYFEVDVIANEKTKTVVCFCGDNSAVLTIDSQRRVIQINDSEEEILPFYQLVEKGRTDREKIHRNGVNFAIGQVDTIQQPYKLKIQLYYEKKLDSVIIDCEIGERRTLISNRVNERYSKIYLKAENGEIRNINSYKL